MDLVLTVWGLLVRPPPPPPLVTVCFGPLLLLLLLFFRGGAGDVPFFGGRGREGRIVVGPPGGIVSGIVDADRSGARGAEALLNFGKDDGSHKRAAGLHYGSGEKDVFQMGPIWWYLPPSFSSENPPLLRPSIVLLIFFLSSLVLSLPLDPPAAPLGPNLAHHLHSLDG